MKQLVPLFPSTARRVFYLSAIAIFGIIAIRSTPTTHANRNQTRGQGLALSKTPASPATGLTLTVNTLGDQVDANFGDSICDVDTGTAGEQCTLRAALNVASGSQTSDVDTINFSVTGTINLTGPLPSVFAFTHINGPGSSLLTIRRDTGGDYGVFLTFGNGNSISGLTITNGKSYPGDATHPNAVDGGGIFNKGGDLTLTDVVITGNRTGDGAAGVTFGGSAGKGAGIYNQGLIRMNNCSVTGNIGGRGGDGNTSPGDGGAGAGISNNGTLIISNSVISGNTGGRGGDGGSFGGRGGPGAGIHSDDGSVTLTNVTISNNVGGDGGSSGDFGGHGGGIAVMNSNVVVTIANSTISNNRSGSSSLPASGYAGGIFNSGVMFIAGSTINGNISGNNGGGILNQGAGTLRMVNSTVSGNSARIGAGVADDINTSLTLTNCTITNNSATLGYSHGVSTAGSDALVRNTIIAYNGPGGAGPDTNGTFVSQGHNLVGYPPPPAMGGSHGFSAPGDQIGTQGAPLNPHLGPLANNGGPTNTHALLAASTALDAGDDCVTPLAQCGQATVSELTTDQRGSGFNRIVDGPDPDSTARVDIGAYEKQAFFPNLADLSTNEDTQATVAFDLDDIASVTSVTATASNSTLVPNNPSVVLAGSTAVLTINPGANLSGTTDITVTVNRTGGSANDTFALTVVAVNDAPSLIGGADQSINENDPAQTVSNWATISPGPADESGQTVTLEILSNSNTDLFSVAPAISSNGTLTYTPRTGVAGTALISLRLTDNGGTANGGSDTVLRSFNINVLEGGALGFSGVGLSISETGGTATITVFRMGGSAGEARINYATSNVSAIAGQDYTASSGTLIFPNGVTTQTFTVSIINDAIHEDTEQLLMTLTNATGSGSLSPGSSTPLYIFDDDPRPIVSINDVQVTEGNSGTTDAVFTVTLTGQTGLQVTVGFSTSNNTATLSDYQPASGQLTFSPGETSKTIAVSVVGETLGETNETFFVNLNFSTNASITRSRGTGTILNDDTSVQFSSQSYSVNESFASVIFQVTRTGITTGSSTVNYATSDSGSATCGISTGNASAGCDYAGTSGTLNFAPGETSKSFAVSLVDDGWLEGNESFSLTLSSPTGAAVGSPGTATVFIFDNDSAGYVPTLFFEPGTSRAIALNSVTFVRGPFSVTDPFNFSVDKQTRVILYTSNLRLTHVDPAYLTVQAATVILPIEKVGTVSGVPGLDASYIIVRLPPGLPAGDLQLIVTLRGHPSTGAVLQIAP